MSKRIVIITIILMGAVLGGYFFQNLLSFDTLKIYRVQLLDFKDSNKTLISIFFVISYILIVAFSLPGSTVASITGGFLFGLFFGTLLNVLGASIGATALFIAVRWGFGDLLTGRIGQIGGRKEKILLKLQKNELFVLLSLRLIPVVPFFVLNILAASVGMKLRNFIFGTVIGILPAAVLFTWIGVGLGEVFDQDADPDLSIIWSLNIFIPFLTLGILSLFPIFLSRND